MAPTGLARDGLLGFEREDLMLSLRYKAGTAERVRTMVKGEEHCCAVLRFTIEEGAVTVTVAALDAVRDAATELFSQFTDGTKPAAVP